jgi:hypothetical protein
MEQGALWEGVVNEEVPAVVLVAQQDDELASDFAHRTCQRLAALAKQGVLVTSAVLAISSWSVARDPTARGRLASALLYRLAEDSGTELVLHAPETLAVDQRAELMALAGVLCEVGAGGTSIVVRFDARHAVHPVRESGVRRATLLPTAVSAPAGIRLPPRPVRLG